MEARTGPVPSVKSQPCPRLEMAKVVDVPFVAVRFRVSSQPVVVAFVAVRFPEIKAFPCTENRAPGVLVATPTLPVPRTESAFTEEVAKVVGEEVAR